MEPIREILNDNTQKYLICTICNESFEKGKGKCIVKEDILVFKCEECISKESESGNQLLLG